MEVNSNSHLETFTAAGRVNMLLNKLLCQIQSLLKWVLRSDRNSQIVFGENAPPMEEACLFSIVLTNGLKPIYSNSLKVIDKAKYWVRLSVEKEVHL